MNKKNINELIKFNEDWLIELRKSLDDPIQQLVGTDSINIKILELELELKSLKKLEELNLNE